MPIPETGYVFKVRVHKMQDVKPKKSTAPAFIWKRSKMQESLHPPSEPDDADGTITVAAGTGLIRATDEQIAEILAAPPEPITPRQPPRTNEIIARLKAGVSSKDITAEFGITRQRVHQIKKKYL